MQDNGTEEPSDEDLETSCLDELIIEDYLVEGVEIQNHLNLEDKEAVNKVSGYFLLSEEVR